MASVVVSTEPYADLLCGVYSKVDAVRVISRGKSKGDWGLYVRKKASGSLAV